MKPAIIPKDRYFATEPAEDMPGILVEQFKNYTRRLEARGILANCRRAMRLYYGKDSTGTYSSSHRIGMGGQQGEDIVVRSNQFRSLAKRFLVMATSDRPAFEVTAQSDSADAPGQVLLAQQLLDASLTDGGLEAQVRLAAEMTIPCGEAYVYQWWDPQAGEPIAVDQVPQYGDDGEPLIDENGRPITQEHPVMSGDIALEAFMLTDVARDLDAPARSDPQWLIVCRWYKRWDLAARFPEKRLDIEGASPDSQMMLGIFGDRRLEGEDWLPVLTLYHARTPAMPQGRMTECVGDVVLMDGTLPYGELPLHRIRPSSELDSDTGYADFWDLIATSEAYDSVMSALVSAHDTQTKPNLLVSDQQNLRVQLLQGGGRILEWRSDGRSPPPSWMQPPPIHEGNLRLREVLLEDLETNSGVNSVARGSSSENTKAASSQALMQSMAVQYASAFMGAVAKLYRDLANGRIKLWQRFASAERTAEVTGHDSERIVTQFSSKDLLGVRTVSVEMAPPMTRTIEGKLAFADRIFERYGPQSLPVEKYIEVAATGRYTPMLRGPMAEIANIRDENDRLMRGQPVEVVPVDVHADHIGEHRALLSNPAIRYNPQRRQLVIEHLVAHAVEYDALRNENPALWAITQKPLPPEMMQMLMSMGGPPPAAPPPQQGGDVPTEDPKAERANVPGSGAEGSELPLMPQNPATGERVPAPGAAQEMPA